MVYISFAIEDFPLDTLSKRSWAEAFAQQLQVLLRQSGQRQLAVHYTGKAPADAHAQADFFLPIVSENYFASHACKQEREALVGPGTRIHAIRHISAKQVAVGRQLQYHTIDDFFEYDPETELTQEFLNFTWRSDHKYWQKLDDVAERIVNSQQPAAKGTVYVASATIDLQPLRDAFIRNLIHRGYKVLPAKPLDIHAPDLEQQIQALLQQADLSLHFFGESYGPLIPNSKNSIIALENEVSYQYATQNALQRVLWVPRDVEIMESRQQAYLEYLRSHAEMQQYSFYLETSFEGVKTFTHELLERLFSERQSNAMIPKTEYAVIICDEMHEQVAHLQQHLQAKGLPCRMLNANDPFPYQMRLVANASAVLLYMHTMHSDWLKYWDRSLYKLKGYRERAGSPNVWLYHEKELPYKVSGQVKHVRNEKEFFAQVG